MTVALNIDRPKLATTTVVAETLTPGTVANVSDSFELRVYLAGVTIDNTVIAASPGISWTGSVITGPADTFNAVRPGDVVSAATGFTSSQIVSTVSADGSTVTTDVVADADTNNEILTFTPGDIDATVYYIKLDHTLSGNVLTLTPKVASFDGTLVADGATNDGDDNLTYSDGTEKVLPALTYNLDTFLSNARVARTN